jgi:hypothetical protein
MSNQTDDQNDGLTYSTQYRPFPDSIGKKITVPEDMINAGKPTDLSRDVDSPETLDEDLSKYSDIEDMEKLHVPTYTGEDADEAGADTNDNKDDDYYDND